MNTQTLAEKVFAILRDLPPDEGWDVADSANGGIQIFGTWQRCKEQPAQHIAREFEEGLVE